MYKIFGDFKIYGKPIDDIVKYNDIDYYSIFQNLILYHIVMINVQILLQIEK